MSSTTTINPVTTELELQDLKRLITFVSDTYKYDFSNYALSSFKRRVQRIMQLNKYTKIDDLIHNLTTDEDFQEKFLSEITVNVTELFRDPLFWNYLRNQVLPDLLVKKGTIKIWHAGCASGEEVMSMTIMLSEMKALENVSILATDFDKKIVDKAMEASINEKKMPQNHSNYLGSGGQRDIRDYFGSDGKECAFDKSLLGNVRFQVHDLVQNEMLEEFDLILCRNVMIYFNQALQDSVIKKFCDSLILNGYLAIGAKETIGWCTIYNKFRIVNSEERVYQKVKD